MPVVISTGGGNLGEVKASIELLRDGVEDLSILHCVSEYPCTHDRLGLEKIQEYIELFQDCKIGVSDHFNGTLSGPIACLLGARVFEKHVTLNRAWKGTDHSFALEPHGFSSFARDIRRVPEMLPVKEDGTLGNEAVFVKLGKSIVASIDMTKGHKLTLDDLSGKIYSEQFVPVRESKNFIGSSLVKDIKRGDLLTYEHIGKKAQE